MEQNKAERLNENVTEKMCSSDGNVVGEMCSPADADTCGNLCACCQGKINKRRIKFKVSSQNNLCKCLQLQAKANIIKKKEAILWQIHPLFMQE